MYHTQVASCVATGLPQKYAHIDRQLDRSKDTHTQYYTHTTFSSLGHSQFSFFNAPPDSFLDSEQLGSLPRCPPIH